MAFLDKIKTLVKADNARISAHAFDRMRENEIKSDALMLDMKRTELLEEYPYYHAGPTALLLHQSTTGPIHAVWGFEKGTKEPLVLGSCLSLKLSLPGLDPATVFFSSFIELFSLLTRRIGRHPSFTAN